MQSKKSGSRKRGSTKAQMEEHVEKRQKEWEEQGTTPRSRAKDMVTDCFGIIGGEVQTVRLQFTRSAAPYVQERLWHQSQRIGNEGQFAFGNKLP